MKHSIIIIDKIHQEILSHIQSKYGANYQPVISYEQLSDIISEYDILVISTRMKIDSNLLEKATNLKLIIRMGIGVDHIDLEYCKNHDIKVAITPYSNVSPVVELVFGQLLRAYRNLDLADLNVRSSKFRKDYPHGNELNGKTILIVGVGRIGSRIATVAKVFGMHTIGVDPILSNSEKSNRDIDVWCDELRGAISQADIVTLHVPLTDLTNGMVNSEFLDLMKDQSILVNASRGKVVNFNDLFKYKNINKFSKIIFDVYDEEPFNPSRIPVHMDMKFFFTPHGGAWTQESLFNRSKEVLEQIEQFDKNLPLHGLIDLDRGY